MSQKKQAFTLAENTPCSDLLPIVRRCAFTLAEVLITLGVIGIVAAITIPALATKINSIVNERQLEVFKAKMAEGMNMYSHKEHGLNIHYNNTEEFVRGLSKHMKMIQICGKDNLRDCFPTDKIYYDKNSEVKSVDVSSLNTAKKLGLNTEGFLDPAGFIMGNGTPVIISWNNNCGSLSSTNGNMLVDPDKPLSNKNLPLGTCIDGLYSLRAKHVKLTYGKDVQPLAVAKVGNSCLLEANNKCLISTAAVLPTPMTKAECNANKSKYGINACQHDPDYWAGAMKMCKDQGMRLPTDEELTELAKYLYNNDSISLSEKTYGTLDISKIPDSLSGIGSSWVYLWSSNESSAYVSYRRSFYNTYTYKGTKHRNIADILAVCVED